MSGTAQLPDRVDTAIVGAGLAGLSCAKRLVEAGQTVVVLEAGDGPGGRVRTDLVDGYRLDRGFQVLLTAYPEVQRSLDLDALDLHRFDPGAVIWADRKGFVIGDPFRDRSSLVDTVRTPILPLGDKLRILWLRHKVRRGAARRLLHGPEQTTRERLVALGFSRRGIDRFFEPLFSGIQLDRGLETSSRMFDIIFRCLSDGDAGVPALGMGAIPDQLTDSLPDGAVALDTRVVAVTAGEARTETGSVQADNVVVATDGPAAARLLGINPPISQSTSCLWFGADIPPTTSRAIVLDGGNTGPVQNLAVMSNVAPSYAPAGRHLVAAACPDDISPTVESVALEQLLGWFGGQVNDWDLLRVDRIEHAQPSQRPPLHARQKVRLDDGRWVCGDHRDTASIQGAMFSGRRTAEAILGLPPARAE